MDGNRTLLAVAAGCSAGGGSGTQVTPAASSSDPGQVDPVYYAFALEPSPGSPGCGPQASFVKVVGTEYYEVTGFGCDATADRGTIHGDEVALVGEVFACAGEGTEFHPHTLKITSGAQDLTIPGATRVVGPTSSVQDLDVWWSEENARVPNPVQADSSHVSQWMTTAAADNWIGNGC